MYTIKWASEFKGFSKDDPMDLQQFVIFFNNNIAERHFTYTTSNKELPSFVVETRINQLPHLIGLQKWSNLPVTQANKQCKYLSSGEWDLPFLEKADFGIYQEYKSRIEFLPHTYNLLYNCECFIKLVHPVMDSPFKRRNINMLFQKDGSKLVFILEMREKSKGVFVPTSASTYNKNSHALRGKHTPVHVKSVSITNI